MRSTALVSLLVSCALLLQSPAAYATPVPSQVDSIGKRQCYGQTCKYAKPADTSQSEVQNLVDLLINALQTYQPPNSNSTV